MLSKERILPASLTTPELFAAGLFLLRLLSAVVFKRFITVSQKERSSPPNNLEAVKRWRGDPSLRKHLNCKASAEQFFSAS